MNILTKLFSPKTTSQNKNKTKGLPPLQKTRRGIHIKSSQEIAKMRESALIVATVFDTLPTGIVIQESP